MLAGNRGRDVVALFIVVTVTSVLRSGDPQTRLAAVKRLVLTRQVNRLASVLAAVATTLREGARASGEFRGDGCVLLDPVGKRVFAILDDAVNESVCVKTNGRRVNLRLGGLVSIIGLASLSRGNRRIIDELKEVLSVSGNDCKLFAVLAHSIELVGESSLKLLTGDVGQLGLSNEGLRLSTHELLLQDNNLGRVWLLVLQLGDLIGNLLLAWTLLVARVQKDTSTYGHGWAGRKPRCYG